MESGAISMGKSWWAGGLGGADEMRQPNREHVARENSFRVAASSHGAGRTNYTLS